MCYKNTLKQEDIGQASLYYCVRMDDELDIRQFTLLDVTITKEKRFL